MGGHLFSPSLFANTVSMRLQNRQTSGSVLTILVAEEPEERKREKEKKMKREQHPARWSERFLAMLENLLNKVLIF